MGGYAAVKLALKHPEQYGVAGDLSGALDITRRRDSLKRWGQTWRIWTIFGLSREARRDEDVFDLLDKATVITDEAWFLSCGREDPLRGVNERFARQVRKRSSNVVQITTPGGHDWQSWKTAMPELFRAAHESLR
jgi:S-formylglutathione hydrolase FrmB